MGFRHPLSILGKRDRFIAGRPLASILFEILNFAPACPILPPLLNYRIDDQGIDGNEKRIGRAGGPGAGIAPGGIPLAGADRPQGLAASKIAEQLDIAPSSLSFHLKELSHAGLVVARSDGRFVIYSANFDTMNGLLGFLTENCCCGDSCVPGAPAGCK